MVSACAEASCRQVVRRKPLLYLRWPLLKETTPIGSATIRTRSASRGEEAMVLVASFRACAVGLWEVRWESRWEMRWREL